MALSLGVAGGLIVDGLISIAHPWRVDYYITIALIGAILILIFFTFPETAYIRTHDDTPSGAIHKGDDKTFAHDESHLDTDHSVNPPKKMSYAQSLRLFNGIYTQDPLSSMILRPFVLILLPPVLWASLVMAVTIGFLVAVTSNVAAAFATAYGFAAWQSGLCFISSFIGSVIGIACGGQITDYVADFFTKRNHGIREPEMRLPAIAISVITAPLATVLYGVGIQYSLHWIVPTIGLGLRKSPFTSNDTNHVLILHSQLLHRTGHQRLPRLYQYVLIPILISIPS